jgi:D-alanine transaminase
VPLDRRSLVAEICRLIERSGVRDGMVYLQLTRGEAPRNHVFPQAARPTLLFYARPLPPPQLPGEGEGVKLLPVRDERWKRCWIKSVALLANVLAKNEAVSQGYDEAVFVENEIVTECSASNVFAVIGGRLITHPVGSKVLPGITRQVLLPIAARIGVAVDERPLREEECRRADELFITSTTRELNWVARWGERYIGQGRCGPITKRLHAEFCARVLAETGPAGATGAAGATAPATAASAPAKPARRAG